MPCDPLCRNQCAISQAALRAVCTTAMWPRCPFLAAHRSKCFIQKSTIPPSPALPSHGTIKSAPTMYTHTHTLSLSRARACTQRRRCTLCRGHPTARAGRTWGRPRRRNAPRRLRTWGAPRGWRTAGLRGWCARHVWGGGLTRSTCRCEECERIGYVSVAACG